MLTGANELWEHACKQLSIGNKQTTPDGTFTLEEVECLGACSWGPALQVNYEYHHNVTPEKLDRLLEALRAIQRT
jgi:NADH-quinone oxidoreductase subunit E